MSASAPTPEPRSPATGAGFATTRWTVVLAAGSDAGDSASARVALEELCRVYWRPVYAFVRRQGRSPHDTQDLTQEFFARLLASGSLGRADPALGRFRSFLLGAVKHFLANDRERARALKRGGGITIVPLDAADTESQGAPSPASPELSPERAYDRQWALALLERVLERLTEEQTAAGKAAQFEVLRETLTADRSGLPYAMIAERLGLSEGAVKVAVHRLRQRYRDLLRAEIAQTVASPDQIETELQELFMALSP